MPPFERPTQDLSTPQLRSTEAAIHIARRSVVRLTDEPSVAATRAQADRMRQRLRVAAAETILSKDPEPKEFFEAPARKVLGSDDPRWILAKETARVLAGAVLPHDRREGLMALAQQLGIRAFDANLIVAIVQDRARRGECLELASSTLELIPRPQGAPREPFALWITIAIVLAIAADAVLVSWLLLS